MFCEYSVPPQLPNKRKSSVVRDCAAPCVVQNRPSAERRPSTNNSSFMVDMVPHKERRAIKAGIIPEHHFRSLAAAPGATPTSPCGASTPCSTVATPALESKALGEMLFVNVQERSGTQSLQPRTQSPPKLTPKINDDMARQPILHANTVPPEGSPDICMKGI